MTGNGTFNITNPPPDLIASECATMEASPITVNLPTPYGGSYGASSLVIGQDLI